MANETTGEIAEQVTEQVSEQVTQNVNQAVDIAGDIVQKSYDFSLKFGGKLIACVIALVIGIRFIHWLTKKIQHDCRFDKLDVNLRGFLSNSLSMAMYILLAIICCSILGINTASLITVLASCGVALGLALQGALTNVAGGFIIMAFRPFHVGDYVEVADVGGTVKRITVFYTFLDTLDNKLIMIPNGNITSSNVTNFTQNGMRRVDIDFSVGYESDIDMVKSEMLRIASRHPRVIRKDEIFARMTSQGDSALVFTLRVWCESKDYWTVYYDLNEEMKKAFDAKGINIPFPQMDVHLTK